MISWSVSISFIGKSYYRKHPFQIRASKNFIYIISMQFIPWRGWNRIFLRFEIFLLGYRTVSTIVQPLQRLRSLLRTQVSLINLSRPTVSRLLPAVVLRRLPSTEGLTRTLRRNKLKLPIEKMQSQLTRIHQNRAEREHSHPHRHHQPQPLLAKSKSTHPPVPVRTSSRKSYLNLDLKSCLTLGRIKMVPPVSTLSKGITMPMTLEC